MKQRNHQVKEKNSYLFGELCNKVLSIKKGFKQHSHLKPFLSIE